MKSSIKLYFGKNYWGKPPGTSKVLRLTSNFIKPIFWETALKRKNMILTRPCRNFIPINFSMILYFKEFSLKKATEISQGLRTLCMLCPFVLLWMLTLICSAKYYQYSAVTCALRLWPWNKCFRGMDSLTTYLRILQTSLLSQAPRRLGRDRFYYILLIIFLLFIHS